MWGGSMWGDRCSVYSTVLLTGLEMLFGNAMENLGQRLGMQPIRPRGARKLAGKVCALLGGPRVLDSSCLLACRYVSSPVATQALATARQSLWQPWELM